MTTVGARILARLREHVDALECVDIIRQSLRGKVSELLER